MNDSLKTRQKRIKRLLITVSGLLMISSLSFVSIAIPSLAQAEEAAQSKPAEKTASATETVSEETTPTHHKLIIQVSTNDIRVQQTALNNAINLQKYYGMDNIDIEIVAYGPGLRMLTTNHTLAPRVSSLIYQDIRFSACGNTMHAIKEKTGFMPKLVEGVETVRAGVARIIELQEQGYSYVRP